MAAENKPQSGVNIAGHVFRWGRAVTTAVLREQRRKATVANEYNAQAAANKAAGLPPPERHSYEPALTLLDSNTAWLITALTRDGLEFFASASFVSERGALMSENACQISLKRMVTAGWLLEVAETERDNSMRGRPAKRYRIPDIFPSGGWEKGQDIFQGCDGNNPKTFSQAVDGENSGIFPTGDGILFPTGDGTNSKPVRGQTPKASVQSDQIDQNYDSDSDNGDDDNGDLGTHERALSPITEAESYPYTEADLESDRVYDGQVDGDCETLDPDAVQEIPLSEMETLWAEARAADDAAERALDDAGREAWAAVSARVVANCKDIDLILDCELRDYFGLPPAIWEPDLREDLLCALADAANAMPSKWNLGVAWMQPRLAATWPAECRADCAQGFAAVMAAVTELATRIDGELMAQPAMAREVANG